MTRMIRFGVAIALLFSLALIPDRTTRAETDCEAPPGHDCPAGDLLFLPLTTDQWKQAYDRFFGGDDPPPDKDTPQDTSGTPTDGTPKQQQDDPPPDTGTPPDTSGTPTDGTPKQETGPPPDTGTTPLAQPDMDARKAAIETVAMAIRGAAGTSGTDADNDSTTDDGSGTATATASWPADTPDDPDTVDTDDSAMGLSIAVVTADGQDPLAFRTKDMPNPDNESETLKKTATTIGGLPGFEHGFVISDSGTHAIVFTDKKQGTPRVEAVAAVTERSVVNFQVTAETLTRLGARFGNTYLGAQVTPPGQGAMTGSLTCPANTSCSVTTDGDDGVIEVTGYVFTGGRAAAPAVEAAEPAENADYLAFGVWMIEDYFADENGNQPAFAAFANGGTEFATPAPLTGKATYNGAAAGMYTEGAREGHFQADATLTADFGTQPETGDDDALGTITGRIDGIVADGVSMSDVIHLTAGAITATGSFAGSARMGAATVREDVATYPYNGSWSGRFYGPAAADGAKGVAALPPAAAGTFGVTGTMGAGDNAVTRSYVGGFGARR